MKPVNLSELIEALEFNSEEHVTKIDLQNGCVVTVDDSLLTAVEEDDEEALVDLPEWQQPQLEIARSIAADSGERFLDAPEKFDFHEYRHMERFIETIKGSEMAEQLWRATSTVDSTEHIFFKLSDDNDYMLRVMYEEPCVPPLEEADQQWAYECWTAYKAAHPELFPPAAS